MERTNDNGAARRLRWTALVAASAVGLLAACGVEGPNVGCTQDSQCGTDRVCKNKICVSPNDKDCAADSDCAASVWTPAGKATTCQAAKCVEKLCKLVNAATDSFCDDGDALKCTSGQCDAAGKCNVPLVPLIDKDQCLIAGACYEASASNPASGENAKCELCNPAQSQTAWSPRPAGSPCPDDKFGCTPDVCDAKGTCTHAIPADNCAFDGQCWKKGTLKEKEECVGCNPAVSQTGWSNMGGDTTCKDDGKPCTDDKCDGKGACSHPATAAGTACSEDDGKTCTVEQCDGKGACGHDKVASDFCLLEGKCLAGGTVNPANPCEKCAPGVKQDAWSPISAGVACTGDALPCTDETCDGAGKCGGAKVKGSACLIDVAGKPTCFAANTPIDKEAPCVICDPGNTKSAPTTLPDNTLCEAGAQCLLGKCEKGVCQNKGPNPNTCYVEADKVCAEANAVNPKNDCQACAPQSSQTAWTTLPKDTSCTADATVCTVDACDGAGKCLHTPDHGKCADKGGPCMTGVCDAGLGCLGVPKPATATCEGADGIACTVETCDGKGACNPAGAATDTLCNDKVACTVDVCDAKLGCLFKPEASKCSDGNECTEDLCDGKVGCKNPNLTDGGKCTDDGLSCTTNTCKAGACKAEPVDDSWCIIDNNCVAGSSETDGGCKYCAPGLNLYKWTQLMPGANCDDDKVACTEDKCDSKVVCQHKPVASACDDGLPCTENECDVKAGCVYTDNCPWGHECSAAQKVCLTEGGKALELVKTDAENPNPTNPAVVAHDLAGGGQKVWVAWQSDAAQQVDSATKGWVIKTANPNGVRIRLLGLENQKAKVGAKVKPEVVTLPVAGFFGGSKTVVQGFPVVARDGMEPKQAWVAWLEADPAQADGAKACLAAGGRGGVLRVARLDGAAANGKVSAAGEVCTSAGGLGPLFLTQGFAVLDGAAADVADVNKRGFLSVRPQGTDLGTWASTVLVKAKTIGDTTAAAEITVKQANVRPVVIDLGAAAKPMERFAVVAVKAGTTKELLVNYVTATGELGGEAGWVKEAGIASALSGATAVCTLDAALAPSGDLGVVLVLRKGGADLVTLVTRSAAGSVAVTEIKSKAPSKGDCRHGLASARIAATNTGFAMMVLTTTFTGPTAGTLDAFTIASGKASGGPVAGVDVVLTDSAADGEASHALAWRGLAGVGPKSGIKLPLVVEAADLAGKRTIQMLNE